MTGLKIEGHISFISDVQLAFIKDVVEFRGFKAAKVVFEPVVQAGDNYLANVVRIFVEGNDGNSFRMIAKIAPTQDTVRVMSNSKVVFSNEHIMYTQVLKKFDQLQNAADIPDEDKLKFPICFGSNTEAPNEVILLEDLKLSGFEMLDKVKPLSNECIRSVLKNFAQFHSLSHVLKHKEPELFNDMKFQLFDIMATLNERDVVKVMFEEMEATAVSVLENDSYKKVAKEAISVTLLTSPKVMRADRESKHAVIHHGDAWTNNIMFKFEDGSLVDSIMIDYQASKSGNPVVDLHHMLFSCTDYESRKQHYYEWIDYYHSELDKNLSAHGLKANYVYPRDQLDTDLKRYGKLSLGLSIVRANMLLLHPEEAGKIKDAIDNADMTKIIKSAKELQGAAKTQLKLRLEGIIKSFAEVGYINV